MIDELESLYSAIHAGSVQNVISGNETIDHLLNAPEKDRRFGITLLIPLSDAIASSISPIRDDIRRIEPQQYFYTGPDLHITVLDLQRAHEGFQRDSDRLENCIRLIETVLPGIEPFEISFKGIILSSAGILIKGYYREGLQHLRTGVRNRAVERGITLRERYQSLSAHVTIVRFKSALLNRRRLTAYIQNNMHRPIGAMTVQEIHLVIHDWYNRRKEVVRRFSLPQRSIRETADDA